MLARGLLCRLAADVPKASTQDLSQLARLLQRSTLSRNGLAPPTVCALSRAYKAALYESRRSYATAARATKPTAKVKRDVKKTAAKKTPAKKSVKKAAAAKPKAKPKRKAAAKKKAAPKKPRRVKKTAEEKEKATLSEYKKRALKEPCTPHAVQAWQVFVGEALAGRTGAADRGRLAEAAAKYKALTPAEKEHYNHLANEKTAARRAEYAAWIRSHTPEQIRMANLARSYLRRKLKGVYKSRPSYTTKLKDDRLVKPAIRPFAAFTVERRSSGDFKGITIGAAAKLCGQEWKALSASEKKKYEDVYLADKARYEKEYQSTYGHAPAA